MFLRLRSQFSTSANVIGAQYADDLNPECEYGQSSVSIFLLFAKIYTVARRSFQSSPFDRHFEAEQMLHEKVDASTVGLATKVLTEITTRSFTWHQ